MSLNPDLVFNWSDEKLNMYCHHSKISSEISPYIREIFSFSCIFIIGEKNYQIHYILTKSVDIRQYFVSL